MMCRYGGTDWIFILNVDKSKGVDLSPGKSYRWQVPLYFKQTLVMDIAHVVWVLPIVIFQEFQIPNTSPSSCLSGRVNRAQQARSQL